MPCGSFRKWNATLESSRQPHSPKEKERDKKLDRACYLQRGCKSSENRSFHNNLFKSIYRRRRPKICISKGYEFIKEENESIHKAKTSNCYKYIQEKLTSKG
ncbi:uncharacterized protein LOC125204442 [Salvia hispanica]|uniref:uncharacterized protein LOC125204442 n=1 Tax=Salvia hispanica TaxID=49212 RepID=UPI0020093673|nr:uncharacterized protein LOC125204442 [Salvia hispanica]